MQIAIVILSAGTASRMGKTKQLLPIRNTTLLGHCIENAMRSEANHVSCVLGASAKEISNSISHYKVDLVMNPNYKKGLSTSIKTGVDYIKNKGFDAVLIMLGDQPDVDASYLNELIQIFKKDPTLIAASKYPENVGVPAIFPKKYFTQLLKLKGDKGAKALLNATSINVITSNRLIDIDTYDDYLNFLKSK